METKAGLIIFLLKRLAGFQLSEMQLCREKNLLWAKSRAGGLGKTSQNKAFQEKKKPLKIVLKLSLSPSLEEEGSHLFFICFPSCPLKEKGAGGLFLGSCSCCRCKKSHFSQIFACWDSCGKLCLHQLGENRAWRGFWRPGNYL